MLSEEQKATALNTPHNISLADHLIDVKVSGFSSSITLGFTNPGGTIQTAATFVIPTDALQTIATEILDAIKKKKSAINKEHKSFNDKI